MRVKSLPRRVNPNSRKSCFLKNGEKCLEILNKRNESFLDLKNPCGLDLSTKKKTPDSDFHTLRKGLEKKDSLLFPQKESSLHKNTNHKNSQILSNSIQILQQDKFKDTFLYQIMTDPQFVENIQKIKRRKKHSCQFCKKEFEAEADLKDHLTVRFDESKRVICCACGKTFAQKRYLRYHQRCHSDRSKFVCDICLKKYSRLDNLTRHNIFHTNPNKFPCTMCDRAFARKDLLNKHQKSHENKYKWYCNECRKYFKGPVTLDNHMKIVHPSETNYNKSGYDVPNCRPGALPTSDK
ncbi:zinc finger protein 510-like [Belonocnema kinseyi]|uniref:zinc finger protein 510-like n=1 Tax=Belonocnema kinseyi TaxID=2817044 RepID=UPI00143DCB9B|nr:zinc finger protein 510-like [Belonocnema kinseyi]